MSQKNLKDMIGPVLPVSSIFFEAGFRNIGILTQNESMLLFTDWPQAHSLL